MREQKEKNLERLLLQKKWHEAKTYSDKCGVEDWAFGQGILQIGLMQYGQASLIADELTVPSVENTILTAGIKISRKQYQEGVDLLKPLYEEGDLSKASLLRSYFLISYLYQGLSGLNAPFEDLLILSEALAKLSDDVEDYRIYINDLIKANQLKQAEKALRRLALKHPGAPELEVLKLSIQKRKQESKSEASSGKEALSPEEALADLHSFIGLESVKTAVSELIKEAEFNQERCLLLGIDPEEEGEGFHFSFRGNPGTGKTSVARVLGQIFKSHGLLEKGHLVETDRAGLIGQYVGETATKTQKIIEDSLDGVLFIDEAYALFRSKDNGNDYGREAIDLLIKAMEDYRDRLCVIFAGYQKEMSLFMESNPGLASRVTHHIDFEDYSDAELIQIAESILQKRHYSLEEEGYEALLDKIDQERVDESFGNARAVRNIITQAIRKKSQKLAGTDFDKAAASILTPEDFGIITSTDRQTMMTEALEELDGLIGLDELKTQIYEIKDYIGYQLEREAKGHKEEPISCNMTNRGNPRTGKTTVARILAKIFKSMGILKRGQFVEASREDLVAGYVGKTAEKTKGLIKQALGGVLFIDEAYALQGQGDNDFGKEAIDTLIKEMEDHRDHLVVILAGYKEEMTDMIHMNPGFESRINFHLDFSDYSHEELLAIYKQACTDAGYILSDEAELVVVDVIETSLQNKTNHFGNGREMRNLFEQTKLKLASRLSQVGLERIDLEGLSRIEACDIPVEGV